jgi:hypothetical protein
LEVANETSGKVATVPIKDKNGRELLSVVLKYTFVVSADGKVDVDDDGAEVLFADEYHGEDPKRASIRKPSQLFLSKPGTDVLLIGHAHPPHGSATHVDVSMRVGSIEKTVRAHGLRVWKAGAFGGLAPGPARPIVEPVPLIYELAWGGTDDSDPEHILAETRNYVGRGVTRNPKRLLGEPAAQLEDPAAPIGGGDNVPACFGAIHRHWEPRIRFAGTYDAAWAEHKMPLLPDDFDDRYHIAVPHEQCAGNPLRGDEPIEILGATPAGAWRFRLPRIAPGFSSVIQGVRQEHRTHLDTLLIDADAGRVELTWRAAMPLPRKYELLDEVLVFRKGVAFGSA